MNRRQKDLAATGHYPTISRHQLGMTNRRPSRPLYGTTLRCECGNFRTTSNEAPSKGGRQDVLHQWERHAEPVIEVGCPTRPLM